MFIYLRWNCDCLEKVPCHPLLYGMWLKNADASLPRVGTLSSLCWWREGWVCSVPTELCLLRLAAFSCARLKHSYVCLRSATEGCHLCETKGKLERPQLPLGERGGGWCRWNGKQRPPPPPPSSLLSHGLTAPGVAGAGAGEWHHLYLMWLWACRGAASFIKGLCWPSHHGNKTIPLYLSNAVLRASRQGEGTDEHDVRVGRWRLHTHKQCFSTSYFLWV